LPSGRIPQNGWARTAAFHAGAQIEKIFMVVRAADGGYN
jgi:hypothetical protein